MKNAELSRQLQRFQQLLAKANALAGDIEIQAHWARYLCVIAAGFLENALTEVYTTFISGKSELRITKYTRSHLDRLSNPKARKFIDTARSFDDKWAIDLSQFLDQKGRREAIDAIMDNRHKIAHGKDSTISLVRLKEYFSLAVDVIDYIEKQCGT